MYKNTLLQLSSDANNANTETVLSYINGFSEIGIQEEGDSKGVAESVILEDSVSPATPTIDTISSNVATVVESNTIDLKAKNESDLKLELFENQMPTTQQQCDVEPPASAMEVVDEVALPMLDGNKDCDTVPMREEAILELDLNIKTTSQSNVEASKEDKISPKLSQVEEKQEVKEPVVKNKVIPAQRHLNFEEILINTQSKLTSKKKDLCSGETNQEVSVRSSVSRKGLYKDKKRSQKYSEKASRIKTNSGSCENSDLEFTSDSEKSSGVGQKGESNDESHSSFSPISFDNSDDNLEKEEILEVVKKCSRENLSISSEKSTKIVNVEDSLADLVDLDSDGDTTGKDQLLLHSVTRE